MLEHSFYTKIDNWKGVEKKRKQEIVGNKTKGWISKRVFQENKARQIFCKTNISYPLIRTRTFLVSEFFLSKHIFKTINWSYNALYKKRNVFSFCFILFFRKCEQKCIKMWVFVIFKKLLFKEELYFSVWNYTGLVRILPGIKMKRFCKGS